MASEVLVLDDVVVKERNDEDLDDGRCCCRIGGVGNRNRYGWGDVGDENDNDDDDIGRWWFRNGRTPLLVDPFQRWFRNETIPSFPTTLWLVFVVDTKFRVVAVYDVVVRAIPVIVVITAAVVDAERVVQVTVGTGGVTTRFVVDGWFIIWRFCSNTRTTLVRLRSTQVDRNGTNVLRVVVRNILPTSGITVLTRFFRRVR